MQIADSVFAISGAASGLGRASAELLIAKGARILLLDRNQELAASVSANWGDKALFVACDVLDSDAIESALSQAVKRWGKISGAINCAGIAPPQKVLNKENRPLPLSDFQKVIDVNLIGTFNLIRLVAAAIANLPIPNKSSDCGVIINTASVAAFEGQVGQAAYAASKGAVAAMALPIARELSRYGIRVMTIAPGIFETPMLAGLPDKARESLGVQVPFPARLGRPQEFAQLCAHIIENEYLNAEVIRLDGALRMAAK
jgi:NAD(P)-dependent dehydrogenase (short-subunit alcohol dehydrogenase family)